MGNRMTKAVRLAELQYKVMNNPMKDFSAKTVPTIMSEINHTKNFKILGDAMEPLIADGDLIAVRSREEINLFPGDVVVLKNPLEPSKFHIRRLMAGPGDELISSDPDEKPIKLEEGQYWVLCDNEKGAEKTDSRVFGPVQEDAIVGRAVQIIGKEDIPNSNKGMEEDMTAGLLDYEQVQSMLDLKKEYEKRLQQQDKSDKK
eukprot:Colp12_sorted_trinity150504_noHs@24887